MTQDEVQNFQSIEIEALCGLIKELNEEDGFSIEVRRKDVELASHVVNDYRDFEILATRQEGKSKYSAVIPVFIKIGAFSEECLLDEDMGIDDLTSEQRSNFLG